MKTLLMFALGFLLLCFIHGIGRGIGGLVGWTLRIISGTLLAIGIAPIAIVLLLFMALAGAGAHTARPY